MQMQWKNKFITTQLKSKYQWDLNFHMPMLKLGERERVRRVTVPLDLDPTAEDLNCNLSFLYDFDISEKCWRVI